MTAAATGAAEAPMIDANDVEPGFGKPVAHVFVTTGVFPHPMKQQDRGSGRASGLPAAAHLDEPVARRAVIDS